MAPKRYEPPIYIPPVRKGRPRKPHAQDKVGHKLGTVIAEPQAGCGEKRGAQVQQTSALVGPRLLDLSGAAIYLGLSPWTVRTLEGQGVLKRIRVPLPDAGEVRKLLFDRADLDRLIELWKEG